MATLNNRWTVALSIPLVVFLAILGTTLVRVHAEIHPEVRTADPIDFDSMEIPVEHVEFPASDGIPLRGWLLHGGADAAPIVLCHELGQSRESLVNTGIALRKAGFTVLLFDFRGHGESGGDGSTLGLHEKRDVLGAVDFLDSRPDVSAQRVGLYGVGMGAHAAVLAASDVARVRVLVLDSVYPDPSFQLVRDVYARWGFATRNLAFLPRAFFSLFQGTRIDGADAASEVGRLPGRHLLLLAPAGDSALAAAMQQMYESIPDQEDADGNLVILPATQRDGLYGEQLQRYHERVAAFFVDRLPIEGV